MKVLVAEDDRQMCDIYRIALRAKGHDVTTTFDGRECVKIYKEEFAKTDGSVSEPFDAVVLDYRMPDVDGLEAAKEILRTNKKQRIIFASAYVKETLLDSVTHLEQIVELIQKPFEPKVLVDVIEDISATKELGEINKMVAEMDHNSPQDDQINQLLAVLKRIQKSGF
jgi:DNA-binding response OmpR family regulator